MMNTQIYRKPKKAHFSRRISAKSQNQLTKFNNSVPVKQSRKSVESNLVGKNEKSVFKAVLNKKFQIVQSTRPPIFIRFSKSKLFHWKMCHRKSARK